MSKRPGIFSSLQQLGGVQKTVSDRAREEIDDIGRSKQKSRVGKAGLLTQHDPAVIQQLKALAVEEGTTQQKLVAQALNMLFAKYGKAQIA